MTQPRMEEPVAVGNQLCMRSFQCLHMVTLWLSSRTVHTVLEFMIKLAKFLLPLKTLANVCFRFTYVLLFISCYDVCVGQQKEKHAQRHGALDKNEKKHANADPRALFDSGH